MVELKLRKFDMSSVKDDNVVVFIGKRRTGKSFVMRDLLSRHAGIPLGVVISPTEEANGFFGDFVPSMFVHGKYEPKLVDNVVRRQKAVIKTSNHEKKTYGSCNIDPRAFLVLDDCMYDSKWTKDEQMKYLFMNGRHVKAMLLITMQYPLGMPPNLRTNIDFVFIMRENLLSNRKRIFESYAGMFNSFDLFCTVLDQCTNNFECLVINNATQSNKLEDQVFWYKATEKPPFKMCDERYWALDKQYSRSTTSETEEVFDLDKLRKGSKLNVKVIKK